MGVGEQLVLVLIVGISLVPILMVSLTTNLILDLSAPVSVITSVLPFSVIEM